MKKTSKKIIVAMALVSCLLSGCGQGKPGDTQIEVEHAYGADITVKDIKARYQYQDNSVMPLYNVATDETFDFTFSSDLSDVSNEEPAVTVHTEKGCSKESEVTTYHIVEKTEKGSRVEVSPVAGVLTTESEDEEYLESNKGVWGNAPIYYIAIHYDMDADTPKKLESPEVIPFTVKHEVNAPEVKAVVGADGCFKLSWKPVEGAEEYRIYKLAGSEQYTGESNESVNGAENGYQNCSLLYEASTSETEFKDFSEERDGLEFHTDSISGKEYVTGQNYSVSGEYYVSAMVGGKESGFSSAVTTAELKLPRELAEGSDLMFQRYESVADMPLNVDVVNIDGSITKRKVLYTYCEQETYLGTMVPAYDYQVEGTALTGYVKVDDEEEEHPQSIGETTPSGNAEPENDVPKTPQNHVPTIIDPEPAQNETSLVEQQKNNTEQHVEQGDTKSVSNPGEDVRYFADSAEEEWLALNMVNGETEISVEAFPSLQNAESLEDVFYKVYYQNPYVLGLKRFAYNYETMTLKVDYMYDKTEIQKKHKEMQEAGKKILGEIIKDGMSELEKENAIYQYLESHAQYDTAALEDAKKNDFKKTNDGQYEDSFNGYGILVNQKGVCQSYAYAYKLLCEMSGVTCRVVTGDLSGNLPHAWNAVKVGETWVQTDVTNNQTTSGIPYFLYNANHETAEMTGFAMDMSFELDSQVDQYQGQENQYEYYQANQLVAQSIEEYEQILDRVLPNATDVISIRYTAEEVDQQELVTAVQRVYNKHGKEDKLASLQCGMHGKYIILR